MYTGGNGVSGSLPSTAAGRLQGGREGEHRRNKRAPKMRTTDDVAKFDGRRCLARAAGIYADNGAIATLNPLQQQLLGLHPMNRTV